MVTVVQTTFCDVIHHYYPLFVSTKSIALSLQCLEVPRTYLDFFLSSQQMSGWLIFPVRIRACTKQISVSCF